MANPELGAKQVCPNCQAKFYDLNRRPAHCPKCGTDFDPEEALKLRSRRARPGYPTDDEDAEPGAAPAGGDDLGVDFAEDEDLAEDEADDVPFLEDEDDDDNLDDEIEGLPGEGDDD